MLTVTAKPETQVRAALIVRDEHGQLLEPQPTAPIPVDASSVATEIRRLRAIYGNRVTIDSRMIFRAREQLATEHAALTA